MALTDLGDGTFYNSDTGQITDASGNPINTMTATGANYGGGAEDYANMLRDPAFEGQLQAYINQMAGEQQGLNPGAAPTPMDVTQGPGLDEMNNLMQQELGGQQNQLEQYVREAAMSGINRGGYNVAGVPSYAAGLQKEAINALAAGYDTRYTNAQNYMNAMNAIKNQAYANQANYASNVGGLEAQGLGIQQKDVQALEEMANAEAQREWGSSERLGTEQFTSQQNAAQRALSIQLQQMGIDAAKANLLASEAFQAGQQANQQQWQGQQNQYQRDAAAALQQAGLDATKANQIAQDTWQAAQNTQQQQFTGTQNEATRALQSQISANQIASQQAIAQGNTQQAEYLQQQNADLQKQLQATSQHFATEQQQAQFAQQTKVQQQATQEAIKQAQGIANIKGGGAGGGTGGGGGGPGGGGGSRGLPDTSSLSDLLSKANMAPSSRTGNYAGTGQWTDPNADWQSDILFNLGYGRDEYGNWVNTWTGDNASQAELQNAIATGMHASDAAGFGNGPSFTNATEQATGQQPTNYGTTPVDQKGTWNDPVLGQEVPTVNGQVVSQYTPGVYNPSTAPSWISGAQQDLTYTGGQAQPTDAGYLGGGGEDFQILMNQLGVYQQPNFDLTQGTDENVTPNQTNLSQYTNPAYYDQTQATEQAPITYSDYMSQYEQGNNGIMNGNDLQDYVNQLIQSYPQSDQTNATTDLNDLITNYGQGTDYTQVQPIDYGNIGDYTQIQPYQDYATQLQQQQQQEYQNYQDIYGNQTINNPYPASSGYTGGAFQGWVPAGYEERNGEMVPYDVLLVYGPNGWEGQDIYGNTLTPTGSEISTALSDWGSAPASAYDYGGSNLGGDMSVGQNMSWGGTGNNTDLTGGLNNDTSGSSDWGW